MTRAERMKFLTNSAALIVSGMGRPNMLVTDEGRQELAKQAVETAAAIVAAVADHPCSYCRRGLARCSCGDV